MDMDCIVTATRHLPGTPHARSRIARASPRMDGSTHHGTPGPSMSKRSPSTRLPTRLLATLVILLGLAAAPAFAQGVPAALKQSGLDLMPWPAHITLQKGRLALTPKFDI